MISGAVIIDSVDQLLPMSLLSLSIPIVSRTLTLVLHCTSTPGDDCRRSTSMDWDLA